MGWAAAISGSVVSWLTISVIFVNFEVSILNLWAVKTNGSRKQSAAVSVSLKL